MSVLQNVMNAIDQEIARLKTARDLLAGETPEPTERRAMTATTKRKMSLAQRKRHARGK